MSGKSTRTRGHNFEREVVKMLRERGWDVYTSRYMSRALDDMGVDIAGDYPRKIQCKCTSVTPKWDELMDTDADTIFWRKTEKKKDKFYKGGDYAIVKLDDFLDLIDNLYKKEKK